MTPAQVLDALTEFGPRLLTLIEIVVAALRRGEEPVVTLRPRPLDVDQVLGQVDAEERQ